MGQLTWQTTDIFELLIWHSQSSENTLLSEVGAKLRNDVIDVLRRHLPTFYDDLEGVRYSQQI